MISRLNTILWAVAACLLWSTAYAGIKLGLQYDTPFHFAGLGFIISGLIIVPFSVAPKEYLMIIGRHWKIICIITILQIVVNYAFFYLGMGIVSGALGAVISWIMVPDENPEWVTVTGMLIITGLLIIFFRNTSNIYYGI